MTPAVWIGLLYLIGIALGILAFCAATMKAIGAGPKAVRLVLQTFKATFLYLLTVATLVGGVLMRAIDGKIKESTTGTLLGAIAAYVLSDLRSQVRRRHEGPPQQGK